MLFKDYYKQKYNLELDQLLDTISLDKFAAVVIDYM